MIRKQFALGAVVATLAVVLAGSDTEAQTGSQRRVSSGDCTRELTRSAFEGSNWQGESAQLAIADGCRAIAARSRGVPEVRARLYSGRAFNRVTGRSGDAITQLEIAVNNGQDREIISQLTRELRVARLELVQAYRVAGRRESARELLELAGPASDPGVAYQRAMLVLEELDVNGRERAFAALTAAFVGQDDARLLGTRENPTGLTLAEIRRGRTLLYWLGMSLGNDALLHDGENDEQRRSDAVRAVGFYGPAADAVQRACPRGRVDCGGITESDPIGGLIPAGSPSPEQLLTASVRLGDAHLQAAGVRKMSGLSAQTNGGGLGARDCFGANLAADADSHFDAARPAFQTAIDRSQQGTRPHDQGRWGMACTILADVSRSENPGEPQRRQLNEAVRHLRGTCDPVILLTRARAEALLGDTATARNSYQLAIDQFGPAAQCRRDDLQGDARAQLLSRIYLERARTNFVGTLSRAARGSDLYARTITAVAEARQESLRDSVGDLREAVRLSETNAEARLTLGHIYLRLGSTGEVDPTFEQARQVLAYFRQNTSNSAEGRPEAYYLLSRRETMLRQNWLLRRRGPLGDGDDAVRYATQAHTMSQIPLYRRQVCLSQILFGRTRRDGESHCAASGQGDQYAESQLYAGLYWLRRGQSEGGNARMGSWAFSVIAFNEGLAAVSANYRVEPVHPSLADRDPSGNGRIRLQELLRYGQRFALTCMNPRYEDNHQASQIVLDFFTLAGMPQECGGSPS